MSQYTDQLFGNPSIVRRLLSDRGAITRLNTAYFDNSGQIRRRVFEGYSDLSSVYVRNGMSKLVDKVGQFLIDGFFTTAVPATTDNCFQPDGDPEALRLLELQIQKTFVNLFNTPNLRFAFDTNVKHKAMTINILSLPELDLPNIKEALAWSDGFFRLTIGDSCVSVTIPYGYIKDLCDLALMNASQNQLFGRSATVDSAVVVEKFREDFEAVAIAEYYQYLNTMKELAFVDYMITVYAKFANLYVPGEDINPVLDQLKKDPAIASGDRTVASNLAIARICLEEKAGLNPEDIFTMCAPSNEEVANVVGLLDTDNSKKFTIATSLEYYKEIESEDKTLVPQIYISKILHYIIISAMTYAGGRNTIINDYMTKVEEVFESAKLIAMSTLGKSYTTALGKQLEFWKSRWVALKNPNVLNHKTGEMVANIVYEVAV